MPLKSLAERFGKSREPSTDVWEVLYTTRAVRRLKPDPIPDDVIYQLLDAAIRAPSGGNQQAWRFIVVRDAAIKRQLRDLYADCLARLFATGYGAPPTGVGVSSEQVAAAERMRRSAQYLADHLHEVPVIVMACIRSTGRAGLTTGASIYPAVWSLQLAARALGIGSALTTVHRFREAEFKALLGIPEDYETAALVPLGYPRGSFGVGPRLPVERVATFESWAGPPLSAPSA